MHSYCHIESYNHTKKEKIIFLVEERITQTVLLIQISIICITADSGLEIKW